MKQHRRDFIKKMGLLGVGAGLIPPITALAESEVQSSAPASKNEKGKPVMLNILQTTDVHCQVHPHDDLFWENNQPVFRKTGGYAQMTTYLKQERKKNPHTFLIDTGDMFQGSEL